MRYFVLSLLFIISSCATQVKTLKEDKDLKLSDQTGYILFGIDTNQNLKSLLLNGEQKIRLTHKNLRKGSNYLLVDLKAGTYYIEKVNFSFGWSGWFKNQEFWNITIKPQQINYVGHLEVSTDGDWSLKAATELVNRSSEALEFMEKNFPNILNSRKMVYGGPGEDDFFEVAIKKEKK